MDILVLIRDFIIDSIYNLPVGIISVILRLGFLLVISTVLLYFSWLYLPWRTVFSQASVAFLAIVISLYVPFERVRENGKEFLTFFIFLAILCMVYLPSKIPFWLTPQLGTQIRLKRIIPYVIWGILTLQTILW